MVATGLEVLCAERAASFRGRRVGVLCHPASVASDLTHAVDRLIQAGIRPARLFGPEHGVRGEAQVLVAPWSDRPLREGVADGFCTLSPLVVRGERLVREGDRRSFKRVKPDTQRACAWISHARMIGDAIVSCHHKAR